MTHPIIEDLNWRHTTKMYDPTRKVPQEDLDVLFEAMRLSASSINSQPWKFIVIESDAAKHRMYHTFSEANKYNQPHVFDSSHIILFAYNPHYTRDDFAKIIDKYIEDERITPDKRDAAFNSFRFAELYTDEHGYNGGWTKAQMFLALGNTLHTLARLRIDSTPLEGIDIDRVNAEFKQELDGYQCDVALAIGYCHEDDYNAKLPKSRLDMKDILVKL
jgi:nitroreductase/dihydropteridine reductase